MLPSPEDFDAAMQDLGVGNGMQIVIYDSMVFFQRPARGGCFDTLDITR